MDLALGHAAWVVWTGADPGMGQVYGQVVKIGFSPPGVFIREVTPEGERIFRCSRGNSLGRLRKLSLLEILALVSQPFYFENPDIRLCESDDCPKIVDVQKGLYCSLNCAQGDA